MAKLRDRVTRQNLPEGQDGEALVLDSNSPDGLRWQPGVDRLITDMSPQLSGDLDANDNSITGINNLVFTDDQGEVAGIDNENLVDKTASETIAGAWTYNSNLAMGSNKITGLADPTGNQEAATKSYVDTKTATAGGPGPIEIWLGKLDIATSSSASGGGSYWAMDQVLHTTKAGESSRVTFNDTVTGTNVVCGVGTWQIDFTTVQIHSSRKCDMELYIDDAYLIGKIDVTGLPASRYFDGEAIFSVSSGTRPLALWTTTGQMGWTAAADGEMYVKVQRLV